MKGKKVKKNLVAEENRAISLGATCCSAITARIFLFLHFFFFLMVAKFRGEELGFGNPKGDGAWKS